MLGTVGYMSPEQVRGQAADHRSDIFAFGAILYEMLSGRRAFQGDTTADTITAILKKSRPTCRRRIRTSIPGSTASSGTASRRTRRSGFSPRAISRSIWRRCPESRRRVQSPPRRAGEEAATASDPRSPGARSRRSGGDVRRSEARGAGAPLVPSAHVPARIDRFRPFRPGRPDDHLQRVLGGPADRAFSRALGYSRVESVRRRWARTCSACRPRVRLRCRSETVSSGAFTNVGTLARATLAGVRLRARFSKTSSSPTGVRTAGASRSSGTSEDGTAWSIRSARSFTRPTAGSATRGCHPTETESRSSTIPPRGDNGGTVAVLDGAGNKKTISELVRIVRRPGLGAGRQGGLVHGGAGRARTRRSTRPAFPGKTRLLARVTGSLTLHDVVAGRPRARHPRQPADRHRRSARRRDRQRDLSWLDWGTLRDVSPDGKIVLFEESGEGGGPGYSVYVRNLDGSPADPSR